MRGTVHRVKPGLSGEKLRQAGVTQEAVCDVCWVFMFGAGVWVLTLQNVSVTYHSIRGQEFIKLYVLFNLLEICERVRLSSLTVAQVRGSVPQQRKSRIGRLGFGTGRQKMALERWTIPKLQRRTCSPRYGRPYWRKNSAGVAKRPRELISHP